MEWMITLTKKMEVVERQAMEKLKVWVLKVGYNGFVLLIEGIWTIFVAYSQIYGTRFILFLSGEFIIVKILF